MDSTKLTIDMKKILVAVILALPIFASLPAQAGAQVFNLNQIASTTQSAPYFGILMGNGKGNGKVTASSTPSVSAYYATSTTLASRFPFASTTAISTATLYTTASSTIGGILNVAGTATSTFDGALQGNYLNMIGTAATSTFATGIDITTGTGCFAIAGTCLQTIVSSASAYKQAVRFASTTTLPANVYNNGTGGVGATLTGSSNAALYIDGNTPIAGDRILVKNEAAGANNGIYTVTQLGSGILPYIITRATDYNNSADVFPGVANFVNGGTVNANTCWILTNTTAVTIGTTALTYADECGAGSFSGTYPIIVTGTTISFPATSTLYGTGTGGQGLFWNNNISGPSWFATTTAGTGLTYNGTSFTVNTSQNIATLSNLATNGYVKTSGGVGTLGVQAVPIPIVDGGSNNTTYNSHLLLAFDGTRIVATSSPTAANYYATSTSLVSIFPNASTTNFSVATSLFIPTSAAPSFSVLGQLVINSATASSSLQWADGTTRFAVHAETDTVWNISTTTTVAGSTTVMLAGPIRQTKYTQMGCTSSGGTFNVQIGNGYSSSTMVVSSTAASTTFTTLSSNNIFYKGDRRYIVYGTPSATTITQLSCTMGRIYVAE